MVSGPPPRLQGMMMVTCFSGKESAGFSGVLSVVSCWGWLSGLGVSAVLPPQAAKLRTMMSARARDMSFFIVFSPLFLNFNKLRCDFSGIHYKFDCLKSVRLREIGQIFPLVRE